MDGIQAIARCEPGRLSLLTRNEIDRTSRYPDLEVIEEAMRAGRCHDVFQSSFQAIGAVPRASNPSKIELPGPTQPGLFDPCLLP